MNSTPCKCCGKPVTQKRVPAKEYCVYCQDGDCARCIDVEDHLNCPYRANRKRIKYLADRAAQGLPLFEGPER